MTNKVRIRAWQEDGDSARNMTDRLSRQGYLGRQGRLGCQDLSNV
jgi:hypothetical protein